MQPTENAQIFIIDDDAGVREALAWLLRSRRLSSQCFESADAFVAQWQPDWLPDQPSCMLLDVRMPGMSGLALFEWLIERDLLAVCPVIFLTGHADIPTAVDSVKRGAFDFCEKPFSDNALVDRIEREIAPLEVAVFNIGANVPCSILDETARKYFKIWEMACFSGFLNGREVAKRMVQRQRQCGACKLRGHESGHAGRRDAGKALAPHAAEGRRRVGVAHPRRRTPAAPRHARPGGCGLHRCLNQGIDVRRLRFGHTRDQRVVVRVQYINRGAVHRIDEFATDEELVLYVVHVCPVGMLCSRWGNFD